MNGRHAGFSLIEMVVVLLIGSLIVLMVAQLYALSVRHAINQENIADNINHQLFTTDGLMANLRLAGLGIDESVLAQVMPQGVLVHQNQLAHQNPHSLNLTPYLTIPITVKQAHTDTPSDQLSIIYKAPQDMWNCEGEMVLGPRQVRLTTGELAQVDGQVVIERYFIQNDDGVMNLRCDAAKFVPESIERDGTRDRRFAQSASSYLNAIIDKQAGDTTDDNGNKVKRVRTANTIDGLGGQGEVIAQNIEGMWVRLGVQTADGVRMIPPDKYRADDGLVVLIDVALLTHSSVMQADEYDESAIRQFDVFGKMVTLGDNAPDGNRRLHHLSVQLRNVSGGVP